MQSSKQTRTLPDKKITNQVLQTVKQYINKNSTYTEEEWQHDNFLRDLLRAVSVQNVALYKELMVYSEENKIQYKQKFKQTQSEGLSCLHVASINGRSAMIKLLIEDYGFGDEINDTNNKIGLSSFQLAIQCFSINDRGYDTIKLMIQHGADLLQPNKKGETVAKIVANLAIENDVTKQILKLYWKKFSERSLLMALWVMYYNMEDKQNVKFNQLNDFYKDAILQLL